MGRRRLGNRRTAVRQTRQHKDLDILIKLDDVVALRTSLEIDGSSLKELWSESAWRKDTLGNRTPTAFVLRNTQGLEFDIHALLLGDSG